MAEHRVVIVGGGVAGVDIASRLSRRRTGRGRLSVALVDKELAHVWKPMLHMIAAGTREVVTQQVPYIVQGHHREFVFEPGEVTAVDRHRRCINLAPIRAGEDELMPARQIGYDTLVLAVGSIVNDFDTPGVRENCHTINSRSEAISFNATLQVRMRRAASNGSAFSVTIVGGGATGVELAAEIVQLADIVERLGVADFGAKLTVSLVEAGDRLLGAFPERVSEAARRRLEKMGVKVRTNAKVQEVAKDAVVLADGERIATDMAVWAAGIQAPAFIRSIEGLEHNRLGQILVGPDLVTTKDRHILAVGDCAAPQLKAGQSVPATAQAAYQEALYVSARLPAILEGRAVPDFRYRDFGSLVALGGYDAYGTLGRFGLFGGGFIKGRVAHLGHTVLYRRHQARLHGWGRAGLLWLADLIGDRVVSRAKLA